MSAEPRTSLAGLLGDIPFRTHCDHHAEAEDLRKILDKRDIHIAQQQAELGRLRTLLGAVCAAQPDGRISLDWDDIECGMRADLTVYGWRDELVVIQDHEYVPDDGDALDRHLEAGQ